MSEAKTHTCINTVNPMYGPPPCEACAEMPRCPHGWRLVVDKCDSCSLAEATKRISLLQDEHCIVCWGLNLLNEADDEAKEAEHVSDAPLARAVVTLYATAMQGRPFLVCTEHGAMLAGKMGDAPFAALIQ